MQNDEFLEKHNLFSYTVEYTKQVNVLSKTKACWTLILIWKM